MSTKNEELVKCKELYRKLVKKLNEKKEIDEERADIEDRLKQLEKRGQEVNHELNIFARLSIGTDEDDDER